MAGKLFEEFPPTRTEQWEEAIAKDLQAADRSKLVWQLEDGISVQPYYRREHLQGLPHLHAAPGEPPFLRGTRTSNDWHIVEIPENTSAPDRIQAYAWREAGATGVEELAFALAAAVDLLSAADDVEQTATRVSFMVGIGPNFFFEIAKVRALRTLWTQIIQSFGIDPERAKAVIHARTLAYNQTVYAAHVNVLRSTTEAMSAALAGVDSLHVEPFDSAYRAPDEHSRRLARNTHAILKHEASFNEVVDPAGGSYYVEVLTDSIARAAWGLFQDIESRGGLSNASDFVEEQIQSSGRSRQAEVNARQQALVGTNRYPHSGETMLPQIEKLSDGRIAEPFEDVRLRTERAAQVPQFLLAEVGNLKMRTTRSAFIREFLGCGGFQVKTEFFADIHEIAAAAAGVSAVVLCSSDEEYERFLRPLREALRPEVPILIAGAPKNAEQLRAEGAADFLHSRTNAVEKLRLLQDRLGI